MLHAIALHKSRLYQRYTGMRSSDTARITGEDEITSTVFGPLDFMNADQVHRFWQLVLHAMGRGKVMPATPPLRAHLALWPHQPISGRKGRGVEPDAHVTLIWRDGKRIDILVEVKWRQTLDREAVERQLQEQWHGYLDEEARECAWHFFIAPTIGDVLSEAFVEGGDRPAGRLVPMTWLALRAVLSGLAGDGDGLARWAACSDCFLDRIGIRRFRGFAHLGCALADTPISHQTFYAGLRHGFKGFGRAAACLPESHTLFQSCFEE